VVGQPDLSTLAFTVNGSEIRYGAFLTVVVNLLLLAVVLFGSAQSAARGRPRGRVAFASFGSRPASASAARSR